MESGSGKVYLSNIENNISNDPKLFWRFIQSKKKTTTIPGELHDETTNYTTPAEIVNGFAEFFNSVYLPRPSQSVSVSSPIEMNSIHVNSITEGDIISAIKKLPNKMTSCLLYTSDAADD